MKHGHSIAAKAANSRAAAKVLLQHGAAAASVLQKAHAAYGPYFVVLRRPPQCCSLAAAVPDHSWGMEPNDGQKPEWNPDGRGALQQYWGAVASSAAMRRCSGHYTWTPGLGNYHRSGNVHWECAGNVLPLAA